MTTLTPTAPIDEARVEAFVGQVICDLAGTFTSALAAIGDEVGLWRALGDGGPASSAELAARTETSERYVREWCHAMASAGYIERDAETGRYVLPAEHALVLAHATTPAYLAGTIQMTRGMLGAVDGVADAFRDGGGFHIDRYGDDFWAGLERSTGNGFDQALVQTWVPSIDGLEEKLTNGARFADIGCGTGRALIRLAEAFPKSTFYGFDVSEEAVRRARIKVREAGVADRVEIRLLDATQGLPETYDVISTFDVLHDSSDPHAIVRSVRAALAEGGTYICLEIASEDHHEDNAGPLAALKYGFSVLYCMTTSLANDGAGLGTCGLPEGKLRALVGEHGFTHVRSIAETPFEQVYEIRA